MYFKKNLFLWYEKHVKKVGYNLKGISKNVKHLTIRQNYLKK